MYIFDKEKVKKVFYEVVEAGKVGGFLDEDGASYVRFDYFLNNNYIIKK